MFEDFCRAHYPGAQRFWEGDLEIDLVAPDPSDPEGLLVAEVKWRRLTRSERITLLRELEGKWSRCSLRKSHPKVRFEILDQTLIGQAA